MLQIHKMHAVTNSHSGHRKCSLLLLIVLQQISTTLPMPVADVESLTSEEIDKHRFKANVVDDFLINFGYLPKANIEIGSLTSEETFKNALESLQRFGNIPITGVVDDATRKLIRQPRCGLPDQDTGDFSLSNSIPNRRRKRFTVQGQKWDHNDINWSLVNISMLHQGQVRRIFSEALGEWAKHSRLRFRETSDPEADIQVMFASENHGDGYSFDKQGGILAHAFFPGSGYGGDAHFDADERWDFANKGEGTSLMGVAVHEFGHSLGLGHSDVKGAIMFPWYQAYDKEKSLPEDDRLAIQQVYGANERQWGDLKPQQPRRPTMRTTTTTTTTTPRPRVTSRPYVTPRPYNPKYNPSKDDGEKRKKPKYSPRYNGQRPSTPYKPHVDTDLKPNACDTDIDAISLIRNELFIFKDRYFWRYPDKIEYNPRNEPIANHKFWKGLPANYDRVDAVYENKMKKIVFFIGKYYFVLNGVDLAPGYPKPLTHLGLPADLEKLDAAFIWGHNNRTFFFSGALYWKFDEDLGKVELDYPRDLSMWRGIGYNINTAFQFRDGKTYFFKGKGFWKFDDTRMRIAHDQQRSLADHWMGCTKTDIELATRRRKQPFTQDPTIATSAARRLSALVWTLLPLFSILVSHL